MRVVSRRVLEMSLSGGSARSVSGEVRLVMVNVWGLSVRLMTMGRMSVLVPCRWLRRALARRVYFRGQVMRCERG
jgi:hypothetical protein